MDYMSAFRCSVFKLYADKLEEIIRSIVEKIESGEKKEYRQVVEGVRERVQKIMKYTSSGCRSMNLSELDNILFDISTAVNILKSYFDQQGGEGKELAELCSKCLDVLRQMRDIVGREMAVQPTAPYPGILYLPARLEETYSRLRETTPHELTDKEKQILRHLQETGGKKTLSELSRELGMDRANLFRYLKSLVLKGYVTREYDRKRRKIVYSARA